VGYNNIRFDDELTRYTLYRNLLDPFAREWQNGNSRWDLLNVARMTRALRPEGLIWPEGTDGRPSLRLELLTAANEISHGQAHDALCDVQATLELAVRLRRAQPRLFQFLWENRLKARVLAVTSPGTLTPFLWCAPRLSIERMNLGLVVVVGRQPGNPNALITYDLAYSPHQAMESEWLDEPGEINPFGLLHVNRAPAIAPLKALRDEDAHRLGLCPKTAFQHLEQLKALPYRKSPAYQKFMQPFPAPIDRDIDWDLYGGFPTESDRQRLRDFRSGDSETFLKMPDHFDNSAYQELCRRFQGRNFPETLTEEAAQIWRNHCAACWTDASRGALTLEAYRARIAELRDRHAGEPITLALLDALDAYGAEKTAMLGPS
jgi:exodeoxyribonuclease-1